MVQRHPDATESEATLRDLKAIAVFCGSNFGGSEVYAEGARALGTALAKAGVTLVYGGTTKGLMGVVADAALAAVLAELETES